MNSVLKIRKIKQKLCRHEYSNDLSIHGDWDNNVVASTTCSKCGKALYFNQNPKIMMVNHLNQEERDRLVNQMVHATEEEFKCEIHGGFYYSLRKRYSNVLDKYNGRTI